MEAQDFKTKDWFHSFDVDSFNRKVAYVHFMNLEVLNTIPSDYLVHFVSNKTVSRSNYVSTSIAPTFYKEPIEKAKPHDIKKDLAYLRMFCSPKTLENIAYEVNDGDDAITNDSDIFPEVRKTMEKLINDNGFDVICDLVCKN